jgi:hypothetical protein
MEEIILQAMAFELEDRYPSCEAFARDLREYQERTLSPGSSASRGG